MHRRRLAIGVLLVTAFLMAGCTGAGPSGAPSTTDPCLRDWSTEAKRSPLGSDGVNNRCNLFSFGGSYTANTEVQEFRWENTLGRAWLSWGSAPETGAVDITIEDSAGRQVYKHTFDPTATSATQTIPDGAAGDWSIQISFIAFSGSIGLTLWAQP